ncbi:MAG: vanadium-dependent haloperoxidase [Bacteroidota bacterium]
MSTQISNTRFLTLCCFGALLVGSMAGHGQMVPTEFKPFKFELEEPIRPQEAKALQKEVSEILAAQKEMEGDAWSISYWNGAYPSYRWHELLMEASGNHKGHKNGGRVAILHLSIYDALVEVWEHKTKHVQQAAYQSYQQVKKLGRETEYSAFICEWSAAAGAAHRVIGHYFPNQKEWLDGQLADFKAARLATGLQFPSDIASGLEIGRKIADRYIEYSKSDRTDRRWEGTVPNVDTLWTGNPGPWDPMKRQWKPLTLLQADQFRPAPPPTDWTADMEELQQFNASHPYSEIAWKWKSQPIWDRLVERKILEYNLDPMQAAFANAVFHTARFDGIIAAWDGKYHYWGIRPFQYDPTFKPLLIDTPNFPGYPAGHTTVAGSIARVLAFLFPRDEALFYELAKECSESRFEGGAHFRTDNEVGLEVGYQVGQQVINVFTE